MTKRQIKRTKQTIRNFRQKMYDSSNGEERAANQELVYKHQQRLIKSRRF